MNGVELFLLGRTLMKIGEEALPAEGIGGGGHRAVMVVLSDVLGHPDSTVGEIAGRTGLPQSAVSTAVARLREAGSVIATVDPGDRRRSLIRRSETVSERVAEVRASTIDGALASALSSADPETVGEAVRVLEWLRDRLADQSGDASSAPKMTDETSR
ncbi:MarR family transcriptional regulator [Spirillospora sp. NPDC047279]|uniref:MarR family winged helix-turn-helix transcriptional regulator n=1 Tax=Spirillospora sp. NPDC047279 TaxID=3155478 RepID=UPI0033F20C4F